MQRVMLRAPVDRAVREISAKRRFVLLIHAKTAGLVVSMQRVMLCALVDRAVREISAKRRFVLLIHAKTVGLVVSVHQVLQCAPAAPHGQVSLARYLFKRVHRIRA